MEVFLFDLKLPETSEFSKRFNAVSTLFDIAMREDTKEAWDNFCSAKYCLEQGCGSQEINRSNNENMVD